MILLLYDLTKKDQQEKCFHYSNLQPLWALENIKKGSKIILIVFKKILLIYNYMDSEIQKEILKELEDSFSDLLTPSEKNSKAERKKNLGSEISVIFNNAKSFNSIDKTKFIYKNKPLQKQLNYMSNFISDDVFS